MEYKYYRELKHNYLVFEDKSAAKESRYQYKIAQSGRIRGLVPCAERNINGEKYFYYEINSMQTIRDRFSSNKMNADQLKKLLGDIKEVLEGLSEFLLGEEGVVFNCGSIYTDLSSGDYRFIYCPFFDEQKSFSEFTMELLELVDEKDEQATELAYRLCEQSAALGDFTYETIEKTLGEVPTENRDRCYEEKRVEALPENFNEPDEDYSDVYDEFEEEEERGRLKSAGRRLGGKLQLLFSLMFFCVVGAMVYIRMNYVLSSEENMLSILVMLVSVITGVVAMAGGFKELRKTGTDVEKRAKKTSELDEDEMYPEQIDCGDEDDGFGYDDDYAYQSPVRGESSFAGNRIECGETVVLDEVKSDGIALFSRNLDKTVRIALDRLPLTVGKMEGCVDKVLGDMSISRMHCKFINDSGRIAIIDLGSTNGSYRNGLRLTPQQKTYIEEGDEIRLGRVCFDCR